MCKYQYHYQLRLTADTLRPCALRPYGTPDALQVHCGDAAVEARLEQKINEACISFEKKPQEVAQVGSHA